MRAAVDATEKQAGHGAASLWTSSRQQQEHTTLASINISSWHQHAAGWHAADGDAPYWFTKWCGLLLQGLKHPLLAAGAGMVWNVGRVIYTLGEVLQVV
jgi:hypothetical protein